jgi:ABC-type oligopeptide transport system substrate-binding subunit
MLLDRNPKYHGSFEGNIRKLEINYSKKKENLLQEYLDDNLDWLDVEDMTLDQLAYFQNHLSEEFISFPLSSTRYLEFDFLKPPFDDPRVRRALSLSTDQNTLAGKVFGGLEYPANGGIIPPGMPGHSPEIGLPFDPDQAKFLLSEAGYPAGKNFPIMTGIVHKNRLRNLQLAEYMKSQWKETLNININWKVLEWSELLDQLLTKKPSLLLGGWTADYHDPNSFFVDANWNRIQTQPFLWRSPKFSSLIKKAKKARSQKERIKLYVLADILLVEEAPVIPIFYGLTQGILKPWVKNFKFSPMNDTYIKDAICVEH